jgi:type II secretory pathway pseudopilin PulG
MTVRFKPKSLQRCRSGGFSIIEATIGMGLVAMVAVGLFSAFTQGIFSLRMARENLRATQVLLEKVETIRLYSYDQITNAGFIPTNFVSYYDPNSPQKGIAYSGTMTIGDAGLTNTYNNDLRLFTVTVKWKTGMLQRERQFSTFVARNGLQDYVY